jgi:hypothetical protein
MEHASVLPAQIDYKLLKVTLGEDDEGVLRTQDIEAKENPVKNIKPQQLVAGMAFRLLGLDAMPIYKADMAFMQRGDNNGRQLTEISLNGYPNTIVHAAQLLRVFVQNDEVAKNGCIQKNNVSDYLSELVNAEDDEEVVSFSKVKDVKEIVVVYNTSESDAKEKFVLLNNKINGNNKKLGIVYGYEACGYMHLFHGMHNGEAVSFVKIYLKPMHLVVLKNY